MVLEAEAVYRGPTAAAALTTLVPPLLVTLTSCLGFGITPGSKLEMAGFRVRGWEP